MNQNELYHYGIPGQKWYIRRYQNKDGSLTPAGRKRADKLKNKYLELTGKQLKGRALSTKGKARKSVKEEPKKPQTIKELSNDDLKAITNRLRLENDYSKELNTYRTYHPKQVSAGRAFINKIAKEAIVPAFTESGKDVLKAYFTKIGKEAFGIQSSKKKK